MSFLPSPIPNPLELLHVPSEVRPLLEWVIGADWPDGNEKTIWDLADEWFRAADLADAPLRDAAAQVTSAVYATGGTQTQLGEAIKLSWDKLGATDEAALPQLIMVLDVMGQVVQAAGQDIQAAKIEFYIELVLFVIEVIALIVAAFCTFGAASAGIPAVQVATQLTIKEILKKLLKKLAEKGMKELTKAALKKMVKEGAKEALEELVTETAIQGAQIADGHRDGLDVMQIGMSGVAGFAGGFAAAGVGLSLGPGQGFARTLRNDIAGEVAGDVAGNLATGNVPGWDDVGMAAASGGRSSVLGQGTNHLDGLTDSINTQVQNLNNLVNGANQPLSVDVSTASPVSTTTSAGNPVTTTSTGTGGDQGSGGHTNTGGYSDPSFGPSLSGTAAPPAVSVDATAAGVRVDTTSVANATPPSQQVAQQAALQQNAAAQQAAAQQAAGGQAAGGPGLSQASTGQQSAAPAPGTSGAQSGQPTGARPTSLAGPAVSTTGGLAASTGSSPTGLASTSMGSNVSTGANVSTTPGTGVGTSTNTGTNASTSTNTTPSASTNTNSSTSTSTNPSTSTNTGTSTNASTNANVSTGGSGTSVQSGGSSPNVPGQPGGAAPSSGSTATPSPAPGTPGGPATSPAQGGPAAGDARPQGAAPGQGTGPQAPGGGPSRDGQAAADTSAADSSTSGQLSDHDAARLQRAAKITAAMQWVATHRDALSPHHLGGQLVDLARVRVRAETSVQSLYADRRTGDDADIGDDVRRSRQILSDALQAANDRTTPAPGGLDPAAQPTGGPPPAVEDSRNYGDPDGHTMPTAAQQRDLEASLPRNADGSFAAHTDPETGWAGTFDPVPPSADPTRATACVDRALSFASTYAGLPRVAAGRTPTTDGSVPPPQPDGHVRVQDFMGGQFQQLATGLSDSDPQHAADALTAGFDRLEQQLLQNGPGAQAIVCFSRPDGTAHVVNVINHDGEIRYYDGGTRMGRPPFTSGVVQMDGVVVDPDLRATPIPDAPPGHWAADLAAAGTPAPAAPGTTDQTPDSADDVPRFDAGELSGTGRFDPTRRRELRRGTDGFDHFPGDRVGTRRTSLGQLQNIGGGFTYDDNKLPPEDLAGAVLPAPRPVAVDPATPEGAAIVAEAGVNRQIQADRRATWDTMVTPLLPAITAAGFDVTRSTFGGDNQNTQNFRDTMEGVLSDVEFAQLITAMAQYRAQGVDLVRSSERLGLLAGDYLTEHVFTGSTLVTGGVDEQGRPDNFDRILVEANDAGIVILEEKGVGSSLGTRWVENPEDPDGELINSEQTSPEYVHGVLEIDYKLAEALAADPELAERMQRLAADGKIRCIVVRGKDDGTITIQEAVLDPDRLRADTIRLAGYQGQEQQ
ncbi:toxin glutamine deamidase domain-containing protein [Catellatospora sp. KI3]|uniref:WXG100-like domain-containing protein n=1 Tax=Catellatospora sp. KI3 TaxID=3041620 RepID=UPI0024822A52|nr:toxin glutamine deamidase domain-containing protein [Catellatospora sp. KI3]MDI1466340.1 toxin glutamine deamidase domain-containing protein [Catellatospora sp. KI3]